MKKGSIERGRRGLSFATPQLTHQIRRVYRFDTLVH